MVAAEGINYDLLFANRELYISAMEHRHKGMRPRDLVVILKIIILEDIAWQNKGFANNLFINALRSIGSGDGRISHDFEDIVFVLEYRKVLWEELNTCDAPLKTYLITEFEELLANPRIDEWIESNVERGNYPSATAYIIAKIKEWLEANR